VLAGMLTGLFVARDTLCLVEEDDVREWRPSREPEPETAESLRDSIATVERRYERMERPRIAQRGEVGRGRVQKTLRQTKNTKVS
jgi:hypothetical protein